MAIVAAIFIAKKDSDDLRARDHSRILAFARTFAYRHMPTIIALRREIVEIWNFRERTAAGYQLLERPDIVLSQLSIRQFPLGVEEPLWALDDPTAKSVCQLSNLVRDYNAFVEKHVPTLRSIEGSDRNEYMNRLIELQHQLKRIVDAAFKGLAAIHDDMN